MYQHVVKKSVSIPVFVPRTVYTYIHTPHAPGYAASASGILALAGYQCGTMADLLFSIMSRNTNVGNFLLANEYSWVAVQTGWPSRSGVGYIKSSVTLPSACPSTFICKDGQFKWHPLGQQQRQTWPSPPTTFSTRLLNIHPNSSPRPPYQRRQTSSSPNSPP